MAEDRVRRVVLLNSARRWIGEAAHVLLLAEGLRRRGVEVTLGVRRGHELERRAREAGLRVESFNFTGRFSWRTDLPDISRLRSFVRRTGAQIVHCHRGKDHWIAAVALLGLRARPGLIRTRHVVTAMRGHPFNRWLMRRATDRTIAVSDAARRSLARTLPPRELDRVIVVRSAVDLDRFHPRHRDPTLRSEVLQLVEGELAVGLVGRIQRVKGQRVFLEAAARLARGGSPAKFVIAGAERTPGRVQALQRLCDEMNLTGRVVFLPQVLEIHRLIASLDVGAVASLGSEGSSRITYEYMASEVPVVATRVGVLPEVIRDGENGLLCPAGDAQALAAQIERLLGDPSLRQRIAHAGRRHVEEHHNPERWLDEIQALYDEVAATRRRIAVPTPRQIS
jgi:glycosyltransferase involved in cell wall biosynthesis